MKNQTLLESMREQRTQGKMAAPETGETDKPTQDVTAYQSRNLHVGTTAKAGKSELYLMYCWRLSADKSES